MDKLYKDVERAQKVAATFFISSISTLAFLILYYSAFDTSPLVYKNAPFPVVNQIIHPGDAVPIRIEKCNKSPNQTKYTVIRYLQALDGNSSVVLTSSSMVLDPGCVSLISQNNRIPDELPPGWYRLQGVSEVQGVVKPLKIDWQTQPFEVTAVK